MDNENDFLKLIGLIVLVLFIVFVIYKSLNLQKTFFKKTIEGMTNETTTSSSISSSGSGVGANSSSFSAKLSGLNTQNLDTLLISKYRTDYENIIINLEEYVNILMLNLALNVDTSNQENAVKTLNDIGTLNTSMTALNNIMKYVDSK